MPGTSALTESQPIRIVRPGAVVLDTLPPLSLYVHLPWCLKKCPYCDFNSHEVSASTLPSVAARGRASGTDGPASATGSGLDSTLQNRYLDALIADLEAALPQVWGRRVHSIFIGGGTPSLFSPASIDRLLADIRARLPLEPGCEVTLEANPGTFERERFRAFRAAGVTRLSIGVQSFDDASLRAIGRVHDGEQARAAVAEAAEAFDTFNIDLMYALPGQTMAALASDLATALAFKPPHLSIYHLTMEPNTVFANAPPANLPDDDLASDMLDLLVQHTAAAGLQRYEVSAFAREGHRCTHNLNYWRFGDYLGIGAGAHGKLSFPGRIVRQTRWREPAAYMAHATAGRAMSNEQPVTAAELPFEFMLNALRLHGGFELRQFHERTGLSSAALEPGLQRAVEQGLLLKVGSRVQPTARGFDFLNDVMQLFLAPTR